MAQFPFSMNTWWLLTLILLRKDLCDYLTTVNTQNTQDTCIAHAQVLVGHELTMT